MLEQGGPDAKVACHRAQGDIGDGPQHQIATKAIPVDADIPTDATGGAKAVPFGGNGAGLVAIGEHELGIVAAVTQGALQIEGNILAQGGATPELGDGEGRGVVGAAADIQVAGGDIRHHSVAHQGDDGVGALLHQALVAGTGLCHKTGRDAGNNRQQGKCVRRELSCHTWLHEYPVHRGMFTL